MTRRMVPSWAWPREVTEAAATAAAERKKLSAVHGWAERKKAISAARWQPRGVRGWRFQPPCLSASEVKESAKNFRRQRAALLAIGGARRIDHDGRAAGIDLKAREVGKVVQHGLVHQARAARPFIFRAGRRTPRARSTAGAGRPGARVSSRPCTGHAGGDRPSRARPGAIFWCCMRSISALMGAKPVPEASRIIGLESRAEEAAKRPLHAQDFLLFMAPNMVGELAAGHVAYVQLQAGRGPPGCAARWPWSGRGESHRQDEFGCTGPRGSETGRWPAAANSCIASIRGARERGHAHRQLLDGVGALVGHLARLQHHVGQRARAAGQHIPASFLHASALCWCSPCTTEPLSFFALAGAAGAVLAAIGGPTPLRMAAAKYGLSPGAWNVRPLGCTLILKAAGAVCGLVMYRYP